MKTLLRAAVALAAVALTSPALAQQANRGDPKIGLGVGLSGGGTEYLLYVPINATPQIRVEPFLGWTRSDTDANGKSSDVTLGAGVFFVQPVASQFQLYAGGRLASQWFSNRSADGQVKTSSRNTMLGAAAGGEYLPIQRVALGAEFELYYVSVGDTKRTVNGVTTEGGGGSANGTRTTLFVRMYFF